MSTGTLDQRVTALEQLVAGLQGSEALQPNYLTVTPGGQVGADFTGKISADGIVLSPWIAGGPGPITDHDVAWVDPGNALTVAAISGQRQPGGGIGGVDATWARLDAKAEQLTDESQVSLNTADDTGTYQASINVTQYGRGNGSVNAFAGAQARTILDSNGDSGFIQNALGGAIAITALQIVLAFSGSSFSNVVQFNHNLGRIPVAVLLTKNTAGPGDGYPLIAETYGTDSTKTFLQAFDALGNTHSFNSFWSCAVIG